MLTFGDSEHFNPVTLFPEMKDYTIYIDGTSKCFAATGVRVGWGFGPEYVMSKMKIASNGKNFSARAVISTLLGESADSLIFFPIAFAGIIPANELLIMIGTQAFLKSAYEVLILPVTIRVVKYIKKIENTDVYDTNISYNILKVKDI